MVLTRNHTGAFKDGVDSHRVREKTLIKNGKHLISQTMKAVADQLTPVTLSQYAKQDPGAFTKSCLALQTRRRSNANESVIAQLPEPIQAQANWLKKHAKTVTTCLSEPQAETWGSYLLPQTSDDDTRQLIEALWSVDPRRFRQVMAKVTAKVTPASQKYQTRSASFYRRKINKNCLRISKIWLYSRQRLYNRAGIGAYFISTR